jgi:hypothetical protein
MDFTKQYSYLMRDDARGLCSFRRLAQPPANRRSSARAGTPRRALPGIEQATFIKLKKQHILQSVQPEGGALDCFRGLHFKAPDLRLTTVT